VQIQSRIAWALVVLLALPAQGFAEKKDQEKRLDSAADVIRDLLALPEGMPSDILDKAECVCVFPSVKKVAIGVGGSYGKGAMVCRTKPEFGGPWGAPAMMRLEGGSMGFQFGGTATDFVLLVMNPKGAGSLLSSKAKLGADAGVAAGPLGRTASAETDLVMNAEILSYSRSKGLFAGVSLEGSSLRQDKEDNEDLYGRAIEAKEIVIDNAVGVPESAQRLVELLLKASPANKSK
jgi:lipid-binding SYLF domain-containing protein